MPVSVVKNVLHVHLSVPDASGIIDYATDTNAAFNMSLPVENQVDHQSQLCYASAKFPNGYPIVPLEFGQLYVIIKSFIFASHDHSSAANRQFFFVRFSSRLHPI